MKKLLWLVSAAGSVLFLLAAQQGADFSGLVRGNPDKKVMAIVDFHAAGAAQKFADVFNQTLSSDVDGAALFNLASKSFYPAKYPQQPTDFQTPPPPPATPRRGQAPPPTSGGGLWMSDWSGSPVNATYLTFGYAAVQNGVFVARGFVLDLRRPNPTDAQVLAKNYTGSPDEAGARKAAHEFSCDIITQFGGQCIAGSHIYYTHQNSKMAPKEIWVMDADGSNPHAITHYNNTPGCNFTDVSPDGSKIAFVSYAKGQPGIFVFSTDPPRDLRFYNQNASVNGSPSFSPDGKQIIYFSSAPDDNCCRIFIANVNGTAFRPVSPAGAIDSEPKFNPKNDKQIAFSSGRSGKEQLYTMDVSGGNIERITDGSGEASNPAWHPNGKFLAFAWTRGYMAGKFNIFIMDVASRTYNQLTHDEGRNENPTWAPDGVHLAFSSTRGGSDQIYTMLANGQQATKLTSQGYNTNPAWGK